MFTGNSGRLDTTRVGDNRASSIWIRGDYAATVYQNANFRGNATTFVSSDRDFGNDFIRHDRASSIRVVPGGCDSTPGVYLYEKGNHLGRCSKFTADADTLRTLFIRSRTASSIRFVGDWVATTYLGENLQGISSVFTRDDPSFQNDLIGHDRTQSIRVLPRHAVCNGEPGVYLYDGRNFAGDCSRFTSDASNLNAHVIRSRRASSIRVVGRYAATLIRVVAGDTIRDRFTSSDPDLRDNPIGDNQTTSIKLVAPTPEEEPVVRLQIRITTANVRDAGTDDDVLVSLNQNNYTWLDYGAILDFDSKRKGLQSFDGGDFDGNHVFTYDLLTDGVSRVRDIKWITLSKTGSDGWCVQRVELLINSNDVAAVSREFSPRRCLDNTVSDERSVTIPFVTIRNSRNWRMANAHVPRAIPTFTLSSNEIVSRTHSAVGNTLHGKAAHWRNPGFLGSVRVKRSNDSTTRANVFLEGEAPIVTDPSIDISFNLVAGCSGDDLSLKVKNIRVSANFALPKVLLPVTTPLWWLAENYIEKEIKEAFKAYEDQFDRDISIFPARCLSVKVLEDGTIEWTNEVIPSG